MLAILGGMIAILALISAVGAVAVSVVGWFGYQTIRDEAKKRAEEVAAAIAEATAARIAEETLNQMWAQIQASGLSESQADKPADNIPKMQASSTDRPRRRKASSDKSLRKGDEQ